MPNILSEKNYTLGKWGSRKAFNQNSLMQLFNGDRRIVHCVLKKDTNAFFVAQLYEP